MNLFELFIKIGVDDQASKNLSTLSSKLGSGLKTAAKIGTAAISTAAAGVVALTKQSIESYAEFEQLVGGAELMFGEAFETVIKNSQDAYKTVQMSQNEYLQQVNGFATGLKTALDGNEQAAADLAHRIIQAEADVVAATGNSQEAVQNAFNGIMKSNFTMLDNLQIGITPTKEGFQEVIDKVNEWNKTNGKATKYQMGNLADMQSALVDYIGMVGMSGYAQAEASKTISGSISSMKSAWKNLLTGFADDNADFEKLVDDLVYTLAGDENGEGGVINNMLPRIEKAIGGIGVFVKNAGPKLIDTLVSALVDNAPTLVVAAVEIMIALAAGLISAIPELIKSIPVIISEVKKSLKSSESARQIAEIGNDFVSGIKNGFNNLIDGAKTWGKDMIDNFIGGIKAKWNDLKTSVTNMAQGIKDLIGFSEPKKGPLSNFHTYAPDMMDLFAKGIRDNEKTITDQIEKSFDFGERTIGFGAEYSGTNGFAMANGRSFGGMSIGNININIDGAKYTDEQSLAAAIAEEIQSMTEMRAAVYA